MIYLRKSSTWPKGGVPGEGPEGRIRAVGGWEGVRDVYRVLQPSAGPAGADAFFRGSDVASYVPCHLAEPEGGTFAAYPDSGAMVTLCDGTRFLLTVVADGQPLHDGSLIGSTRGIILGDKD